MNEVGSAPNLVTTADDCCVTAPPAVTSQLALLIAVRLLTAASMASLSHMYSTHSTGGYRSVGMSTVLQRVHGRSAAGGRRLSSNTNAAI